MAISLNGMLLGCCDVGDYFFCKYVKLHVYLCF